MLELQNLSRSFRGIPTIENLCFRVGAGEIVGFLGPNGAGKSTAVKIITRLLRPNNSRVLFQGTNIRDDLVGFRAVLGYVPEEAHIYTHLSGLEYLQLVGRLRGMKERLIEIKAKKLLRLLALESWQYSPISSYSKGMKQRVLIAAAVMHDPQLLIFDEPLSGLMSCLRGSSKACCRNWRCRERQFSTSRMFWGAVEQVCSRVIVIAKRKILEDSSPSDLVKLMKLGNLEGAFAELVQQQDTKILARELVEVMKIAKA